MILLNAVGTPVSRPGTTTLGDVWGNVTITSSGVTLKDTVVAGNLYVTAGVELGDVVLENVKVLGEIVVSGGGVSEAGEDSVILRNVDAPKLVVDNIKNQQVSLRVEGDGLIQQASVRTDAFLADNTPAGHGIGEIELNGENGLELKLAGNIKNVVNRTPESALSISSGRVDTITVDEKAVDSTLEISSGAEADHVNLDVGTTVTGDGDIGDLVVNAPGSNVSMLPDQIVIRPGDTANIDGENMDSEAAAESSADPRLLSGYPKITDLAPSSATAQFSGNKRGTVYWAVTSVTDGSVGTDELIDPPSYTTKIVANGSAALSGAGGEVYGKNQQARLRRLLLSFRGAGGCQRGSESVEGALLHDSGQYGARLCRWVPLYVQGHKCVCAGDCDGDQELPALLGAAAQRRAGSHGAGLQGQRRNRKSWLWKQRCDQKHRLFL